MPHFWATQWYPYKTNFNLEMPVQKYIEEFLQKVVFNPLEICEYLCLCVCMFMCI